VKRSFFNRFSKEKYEIIIQSVVEDMNSTSTGKRGIGFWESISKKLINWSPDYINDHFRLPFIFIATHSDSCLLLEYIHSTLVPSFVNIFRTTIDELSANRFPESDTSLVCGGTLHMINYTLDDDFIFLFGEGPFIRSLVAYGMPFFLLISNRINDY